MSKKKNTLKDLDEFLKQQAATLVTPQKLGETKQEIAQPQPKPVDAASAAPAEISADNILEELRHLSKNDRDFRKQLYDLIIKTMEAQSDSLPEDKMLINTALYLKHGKDWKQAIRDYWRKAG